MQITEKGLYETREGKLAFVYAIRESEGYCVFGASIDDCSLSWTAEGKNLKGLERSRFDLVKLVKSYNEIIKGDVK